MRVVRLPKSRRGKFALAAAFAAIGYVAFRVWALFTIHGFVVSFAAVDRGRAVVCVRANDEYGLSYRAWVGVLDARGGWVWSHRLDGVPMSSARNGLIVVDGHVIVRTEVTAGGPGKTSAYSLADGRQEWTRSFDVAQSETYIDLVGASPLVIQGIAAKPSELVALDAASGAVAWKAPMTWGGDSIRVAGPSLLVVHVSDASLLPLTGGPPRVVPSFGAGMCVVGGDVVYLASGRVEAIAIDGKSAPRVVVPSLALPSDITSLHCGMWRGHPVFTTAIRDATKAVKSGLLEVDLASGTQVRFDVLDVGLFLAVVQTSADSRFPDSAPLGGELTRFVPLIVPDGEEMAFAALDMETRTIVRKGPASTSRLRTEIIADHGSFIIDGHTAIGGHELLRFDGATGKITAAARASDIEEVHPFAVADGRIWVYSNRWLDPVPWAVLDTATLTPVHVEGGLVITPATDELAKAWLGP